MSSVLSQPDVVDFRAAAWREHAAALASLFFTAVASRFDCHGLYLAGGGSITAKAVLTLEKLEEHFCGVCVIGLHLIGLDCMCRVVAWDFDQHEDGRREAAAAENFRKAYALYCALEKLGMYPLLEDSNGNGGYHVWVLLAKPRHARDLYHWARSIAPEGCESFPKQTSVAPTPGKGHYGNYVRIPGRHHKRDHWSRFYVDGQWYEGNDAVDLLLGWTPSETDVIPAYVEPEPPPQQAVEPTAADALTAMFHLRRLSPHRADDYDYWLRVGMILHGVDPSAGMLAAWDAWSRQSPSYEPGVCAEKWETFDGDAYAQNNGGRRLGIGTLIWWANEDSGKAQAPSVAAPHAPAPEHIDLVGPHGVTLRLIQVSPTPKKIAARFAVLIDGTDSEAEICLSTAASGFAVAWQSLKKVVEASGKALVESAAVELEAWLTKQATQRALQRILDLRAKAAACNGDKAAQTMFEIVKQRVIALLGLRFMVPDPPAIWSEELGLLLRLNDFTSRLDPELLEAIKAASDYPAPTYNDPTKPIKHLQTLMKTVWCAITKRLPREANADLGPDSNAAALFKQRIMRLWQTTETWIKVDATRDMPAHAERMSLASRVRELVAAGKARPGWQRVLKGVSAFYRVEHAAGEPPKVWLGMRVDLQCQIKDQCVPGVQSPHDLALLANRYGLADATGVPIYITDGDDRAKLVVLSRSICDFLLDCLDDEKDALRGDAALGATEVLGVEQFDPATGEVLNAT